MSLGDRLSHAWNAFRRSPDKMDYTPEFGMQTFGNPSVYYRPVAGDQTIVTSIYNQIAIDVSNVPIDTYLSMKMVTLRVIGEVILMNACISALTSTRLGRGSSRISC